QGENGAEHPGCKIERGDREQDGAAAERLQDRPRLAALLLGERRDPRHLARALGELEPIERGLGAGLGLYAADVADEADEAVRLRAPHRGYRRTRTDRPTPCRPAPPCPSARQ